MSDFSVIGSLYLLTTFTYFTHPHSPPSAKTNLCPLLKTLVLCFLFYFFKMPHVSELTLFLCTCRTSAGLSRSWICYPLSIPWGILGCCVRMIIQWMVNSVRRECDLLLPPVMGQIFPALLCGSGALQLHISKVCGHSEMTLFPTVLIMDITFDKRFIN